MGPVRPQVAWRARPRRSNMRCRETWPRALAAGLALTMLLASRPSGDARGGPVPEFPADLTIIIRTVKEGKGSGSITAIVVRDAAGAVTAIPPKDVKSKKPAARQADILAELDTY